MWLLINNNIIVVQFTLTCASSVEAPKWGVAMTFGCDIRVFSSALFGGSSVKTSNPAPPHLLSYFKTKHCR